MIKGRMCENEELTEGETERYEMSQMGVGSNMGSTSTEGTRGVSR